MTSPLERHASDPRLHQLFLAALPLPPRERIEFLGSNCRDEELRCAVLELLAGHDDAPTFLLEEGLDRLPNAVPMMQQLGPYRILERIGAGAMGVVYRAEQANPNRLVALKVLAGTDLEGDAYRRFRREVELLARLQHPGIAQVFDAGTQPTAFGSVAFFAMELVHGQPLDAAVRDIRSLPQVCELLARIADAVQHAHEQGVVHRDLKPANILVTRGDTGLAPKILDFGIARSLDLAPAATALRTRTGMVVGTLPYMSPEQVRGGEVGAATDVYALGVIAFEVLAGRLPLQVHELPMAEALRAIQDEEPPSLRTLRKDVDVDLATVVAVAMSKSADQRYPSAAALAADLRRCVAQQPIHARPPTTRYRIKKFVRRHQRLVIATASAFVILLAATITASVLAMQNAVLAAEEKAARVAVTTRGEQLRRQNYSLEMTSLLAAMRSPASRANTDAALERWRPSRGERDMRGFEWYLLNSLHRDIAPELPMPDQTYDVRWHPTRPWLLASGKGFSHVIDVVDRRRIADLQYGDHMYTVRWSPSGTMVAGTTGAGFAVKAIGAAGEVQQLFTFAEPNHMMRAVAWHRDEQRIAVFSYKGPAWIVDRTGQRPTVRIDSAFGGNAPDFQPNGDLLAIGGGLAHADDFALVHPYPLQERGNAMRWNHAGTTLAIALRGRPCLIDPGGSLRAMHEVPSDVQAFAWSPDDRSLAMISGNGVVQVHDAATWTLQRTSLNPNLGADGLSLAWSADGHWLAVVRRSHRVALIDCTVAPPLRHVHRPQGQAQFFAGLQWLPNGRELALSLRNRTRVVDPVTGEIAQDRGDTWTLRWSPDGQRRAHWRIPEVVVTNADGGEQRASLVSDLDERRESARLTWRADSRLLLISTRSQLWSWVPGEAPRLLDCHPGLEGVEFARTGGVACVISGGRLSLFDTDQDRVVATCLAPGTQAAQWSHDGRLLACVVHDARNVVEIRDAQTLQLVRELRGCEHNPTDVSWQAGDRRLAAASQGGVCLWDPESGTITGRLADMSLAAWLGFSPDGQQLAVMDAGGAVLVYDARLGYR